MQRWIIAAMVFLMTSCSEDHEVKYDNELIGTWTWLYTAYGDGSYSSPETEGCGQSLEFRDNGTFYWTYTGCEDEGDELSNWYVENGRLVFDDHGEKNYADYSIDNDTLNISTNDGLSETEKWIK